MSLITVTRNSTEHRTIQIVGWAIAALVILAVPFFFDETWVFSPPGVVGDYTIGMSQILLAMAWAVAVLGLNLLIGFSGQISLGHSFFVGIGAYTAGILMLDYDWGFLATLIVIVPACFLLGMIVGIPALRIKGLYLALVTLVLSVIFPTLVRLDWLASFGPDGAYGTRGSNGLNVGASYEPPGWFPVDGLSNLFQGIPLIGGIFGEGELGRRSPERIWTYFLALLIVLVMFWVAHNVIRSRVGRAFIAIRDNETGAAVSGVNVPLYKTLAFGLSSAFAGVGGMMYAFTIGALAPDVFGLNLAIFFIVGLVLGGVATFPGAIIGGLAIVLIPELSSQWATQNTSLAGLQVTGDRPYAGVLLGLFLIIVTFVLPGGIMAGVTRLKKAVLKVVPVPPSGVDARGVELTEDPDDLAEGDDHETRGERVLGTEDDHVDDHVRAGEQTTGA
ncbi:branched-chain amino acid ABC transporter permease [Ilumatobacter sp.]|uniref:branched-chain amino acid ABC transporter permease n=1 Tax=Ilumatobacter sp. TaxID=1967498 RepID=UPI003B52F453